MQVVVERAKERERFARRDLVLQGRGLKRGADLLLHLARPPPRVDAADLDLALVRLAQPEEALDRRGLAGAVRAEQAEDLALLDLEADAIHGEGAVVAFAKLGDDDLGHGVRA